MAPRKRPRIPTKEEPRLGLDQALCLRRGRERPTTRQQQQAPTPPCRQQAAGQTAVSSWSKVLVNLTNLWGQVRPRKWQQMPPWRQKEGYCPARKQNQQQKKSSYVVLARKLKPISSKTGQKRPSWGLRRNKETANTAKPAPVSTMGRACLFFVCLGIILPCTASAAGQGGSSKPLSMEAHRSSSPSTHASAGLGLRQQQQQQQQQQKKGQGPALKVDDPMRFQSTSASTNGALSQKAKKASSAKKAAQTANNKHVAARNEQNYASTVCAKNPKSSSCKKASGRAKKATKSASKAGNKAGEKSGSC